MEPKPHRNSWEHFNPQGVEILNNKGHVTQSLRTTGLPIANIFCPLISRGWKTRGMKVTSHSIGLSNQNPNNVAINKIWGGSEWSVPPPPNCNDLVVIYELCHNYKARVKLCTLRLDVWHRIKLHVKDGAKEAPTVSVTALRAHWGHIEGTLRAHWGHIATITLTYLQKNNCQICQNNSSNIFHFLLKNFQVDGTDNSNLKPSGQYTYRQVYHSKILRSAHTLY